MEGLFMLHVGKASSRPHSFFHIPYHKEAPYKVYGVSLVFYYKEYCILPPGIKRVVELA